MSSDELDLFEDVLTSMFGKVPGPRGKKGGEFTFEIPENVSPPGLLNHENKLTVSLTQTDSTELFAHYVWSSSIEFGYNYFEGKIQIPNGSSIIELGAGAGLPSLCLASMNTPEINNQIVITDYPDENIIDNIQKNLTNNIKSEFRSNCNVLGYCWGEDISTLTNLLPPEKLFFDIIIIADTIWEVCRLFKFSK